MCDIRSFPQHLVYKYVQKSTGEVVYVGKTNASLKARLESHRRDPRFFTYLDDTEILVAAFSTADEADSVELFLIQELSPILNSRVYKGNPAYKIKDAEIDWEPCVFFLEMQKSPQREAILQKAARLDADFLEAALSAYEKGFRDFSTPFVHPSGFIKMQNGPFKITLPDVKALPGGLYMQTLCEGVGLSTWKNRAEYFVWLPVAQAHSFNEKDGAEFDLISRVFDFANRAYRFKEREYEEGAGKYWMELGKNIESLLYFWKPFFEEVSINSRGEFSAKTSEELYKNIPEILEKAALYGVSFFKRTGIIPGDLPKKKRHPS